MLRLIADENFNYDIVRGLLRRNPAIDLVRVQDVGLTGADDSTILGWAAQAGRVLLTHDVTILTHHAYERLRAKQTMPGVFEVNPALPVGQVLSPSSVVTSP